MRVSRVVIFAVLVFAVTALPASALDICEEGCQPPDAEQNTPYEYEFEAEEGCEPYRFSYLNGTVPPGLRITADGKLTGTPTAAGAFQFWVGLDDNGGPHNPACIVPAPQSQGHYFLTVLPDLTVTTETVPQAVPGQPYSVQLGFSNPEIGWRVLWDVTQGSLPQGLSLSESGVISGTPAGVDTKTFVVRAREPFRRFGERQLTLTVATALQGSSSLGPGEIGLRYAGAVSARGGVSPLTYSVASGKLPSGLTLDSNTGTVRGVPRAAGSFGLTFAVTDSAGQRITVPANLRVASRLAVTTTRLPTASIGAAYRARLAASGGLAPKKWRVVRGALPRGIRLDATTGALSGTARQAGVYRITVEARDRLGARSTKALRLTVTG